MDVSLHKSLIAPGAVFTVFGILSVLLFGSSLHARKDLDLEGVIVKSTTSCQEPQGNRCISTYVIRTAANRLLTHEADYNSGAIRRDLPVGSVISKRRGEYDYHLNGKLISDFPGTGHWLVLIFLSCVSAFGLGLALWGLSGLRSKL